MHGSPWPRNEFEVCLNEGEMLIVVRAYGQRVGCQLEDIRYIYIIYISLAGLTSSFYV